MHHRMHLVRAAALSGVTLAVFTGTTACGEQAWPLESSTTHSNALATVTPPLDLGPILTRAGEALDDAQVEPPPDPRSATTPWRWLGVKRYANANCPAPDPDYGWKVRHLFGPNGEYARELPAGLRAYCLYLKKPSGLGADETPTELQMLIKERLLVRLEPDLAIVGGPGQIRQAQLRGVGSASRALLSQPTLASASGDLESLMGPTYRTEFDQHTEPLQSFELVGNRHPVRLGLVDTSPTASPGYATSVVGTSLHGYQMAELGQHIVCDKTGQCVAALSSRLALELRYDEAGNLISDVVNGGTFGTVGWFAEAVRREVQSWEEQCAKGGWRPLVLGMAVGWLAAYGGAGLDFEGWSLPVQTAYEALADAHCRDVGLVAAAGNTSGGATNNEGPLLPAGWEQLPALSNDECWVRAGTEPRGVGLASYRPFLFAMGGLDAVAAPLALSRPQGNPRQVAFADHATVFSASGDQVPVITGTSVSTIVGAASAAVVWAHQPEFGFADVMWAAYGGGQPLNLVADFCLGGGACTDRLHWVTTCSAVVHACTASGIAGLCPDPAMLPLCAGPQAGRPDVSTVSFGTFELLAQDIDATSLSGPFTDPACPGMGLFTTAQSLPTDPCPELQYYGTQAKPWTSSQPGTDPFPNSVAFLWRNSLLLQSKVDVSNYSNVTVTIVRDVQKESISLTTLTSGMRHEVKLDTSLAGAVAVTVSAMWNGTLSTSGMQVVQ